MRLFFLYILSQLAVAGDYFDWDKTFPGPEGIYEAIKEKKAPNGEKWTDELLFDLHKDMLARKPDYRYFGISMSIARNVEDQELRQSVQLSTLAYLDTVFPSPKEMEAAIRERVIGDDYLEILGDFVRSKSDRAYGRVTKAIFWRYRNPPRDPEANRKVAQHVIAADDNKVMLERIKRLFNGPIQRVFSPDLVEAFLDYVDRVNRPDFPMEKRVFVLGILASLAEPFYGGLVPRFSQLVEALAKQERTGPPLDLYHAMILLSQAVYYSKKPEKIARTLLKKLLDDEYFKAHPLRRLTVETLVSGSRAKIREEIDDKVNRFGREPRGLTNEEIGLLQSYARVTSTRKLWELVKKPRVGPVVAPFLWDRVAEEVVSLDLRDKSVVKVLSKLAEIYLTPGLSSKSPMRSKALQLFGLLDVQDLADLLRKKETSELGKIALVVKHYRVSKKLGVGPLRGLVKEPEPSGRATPLQRKRSETLRNAKRERAVEPTSETQDQSDLARGLETRSYNTVLRALQDLKQGRETSFDDFVVRFSEILAFPHDDVKKLGYEVSLGIKKFRGQAHFETAMNDLKEGRIALAYAAGEFLATHFPESKEAFAEVLTSARSRAVYAQKFLELSKRFDLEKMEAGVVEAAHRYLVRTREGLKKNNTKMRKAYQEMINYVGDACDLRGIATNGKKPGKK